MSWCYLPIMLATALASASSSQAADNFLAPLGGSWKGSGIVVLHIGSQPINVNCSFTMKSNSANLSMDGSCSGMLFIRRSVSAQIQSMAKGYSGTYTGPSGQPSILSGSRQGNAINLRVHWAKIVNGDRDAAMTLEKLGDNRLRLKTVDKDLATGKPVVTSRIDLSR